MAFVQQEQQRQQQQQLLNRAMGANNTAQSMASVQNPTPNSPSGVPNPLGNSQAGQPFQGGNPNIPPAMQNQQAMNNNMQNQLNQNNAMQRQQANTALLDRAMGVTPQPQQRNDLHLLTPGVSAGGQPIHTDWRGGQAFVNGIPVNHIDVVDGKARVTQQELDRIMGLVAEQTGIRNPNDIAVQQAQRWDPQQMELFDRLMNPRDISNDPQWRAIQDQYYREGNRAMENAMSGMSGMTGGFVNSAALTAGAQQRNLYNQRLMDMMPQVQQQIFNQNQQALDAAMGLDSHQFNRDMGANTQQRNWIMEQQGIDRERDRWNQIWNRDEDRWNWQTGWDDQFNQQALEANRQGMDMNMLEMLMRQNTLDRDNIVTGGFQQRYDMETERIMLDLSMGQISEQEARMMLADLPNQIGFNDWQRQQSMHWDSQFNQLNYDTGRQAFQWNPTLWQHGMNIDNMNAGSSRISANASATSAGASWMNANTNSQTAGFNRRNQAMETAWSFYSIGDIMMGDMALRNAGFTNAEIENMRSQATQSINTDGWW